MNIVKFKNKDRISRMRIAHISLTDGSTGTWVPVYKDSLELPTVSMYNKTHFYGLCGAGDEIANGDIAAIRVKLEEANIKEWRIESSWTTAGYNRYATSPYGDYKFGISSVVSSHSNAGSGSTTITIGYTDAAWNGWRGKHFLPMKMCRETVSFDENNKAYLTNKPVIVITGPYLGTKGYGFVDTEVYCVSAGAQWDYYENILLTRKQILEANYDSDGIGSDAVHADGAYQYACSIAQKPIDIYSLTLRVSASSGVVNTWFRMNEGFDLYKFKQSDIFPNFPTGSPTASSDKCYFADYKSIRFANSSFQYACRNSYPSSSDKIYASFSAPPSACVYDTSDFLIDNINGIITKKTTSPLDIPIVTDYFDDSELNENWSWQNTPGYYIEGGESYPTSLFVQNPQAVADPFVYTNMSSLEQTITILTTATNIFAMHLYVSAASAVAGTFGGIRYGIRLSKDDNNYVEIYNGVPSYGAPYYGRIYILKRENGVLTALLSGAAQNAPPNLWFNIYKNSDNSFTLFASQQMGVFSSTWIVGNASITTTFTDSWSEGATGYKVQLRVMRGNTGTGIENAMCVFDKFIIVKPRMDDVLQAEVFYHYLDTEEWENFVLASINNFKNYNTQFEFWNEPDASTFLTAGENGFRIINHMANNTADVIRGIDKNIRFIPFGFSDAIGGNSFFMNTIYSEMDKKDYDIMSWHPYNFSSNSPDYVKFGSNSTVHPTASGGINETERNIMLNNYDYKKRVYFGEYNNLGGILARSSNYHNIRTQCDYGIRAIMMARLLGYIQSICFWRVNSKEFSATTSGIPQDQHNSLFQLYKEKPLFYSYRTMAQNKGFIIDLLKYTSAQFASVTVDDYLPGSYNIKKIEIFYQNLDAQSTKVFISQTATSSAAAPELLEGKKLNTESESYWFSITANVTSSELKTERWKAIAQDTSTFLVSATYSGEQGTATKNVPFVSNNDVVRFTLPNQTYVAGDIMFFETFKGDGWLEIIGNITDENNIITIDYDVPYSAARYVYIQFKKLDTEKPFYLSEIKIYNDEDINVAYDKIYSLEGIER